MTSIHTLPPFVPNSRASAAESDPASDARKAQFPLASQSDRTARGENQTAHRLDKIGEIMEAKLSELLGLNIRLSIEQDQEAGVFVYKAVNRATGEVIRQYPTEEMLKLMSYYHQTEGLSVNSSI
jgi:flagellar protein FlaG